MPSTPARRTVPRLRAHAQNHLAPSGLLGQPASVKTGTGALFYYHHDTQGSPVDVTNSTGTLYQRWAYDPFGTRVLGTTTGGAPANPPSYTGARHETTTGNLDLHARQYTTTGRFTRPDPATRAQTTP